MVTKEQWDEILTAGRTYCPVCGADQKFDIPSRRSVLKGSDDSYRCERCNSSGITLDSLITEDADCAWDMSWGG